MHPPRAQSSRLFGAEGVSSLALLPMAISVRPRHDRPRRAHRADGGHVRSARSCPPLRLGAAPSSRRIQKGRIGEAVHMPFPSTR